MRLKFKDDTAIFYPLGFLDGDVSKYEISEKNINSILKLIQKLLRNYSPKIPSLHLNIP